MHLGPTSNEAIMESLRRFGDEAIPQFKDRK